MAEGGGKGDTKLGIGTDPTVAPDPRTKLSDPAIKPTQLSDSDAAGTTGRAPLEGRVDSLTVVERAHYDVQGEFGRGGLGRVLRARDRRTGRIVAVKEALRATPGLLARFAREAIVTANLQHPSIVPVYEVGRWASGEPFYAMKLVAGRSLAEAAKQAASLRERIALLSHLIAVADALAYAHGERVIHRDLKPANVLIGDYGETVVIDWGLAKRLGDTDDLGDASEDTGDGKTVAGSVMGTPGYMAPEQARGETVDERADVYAVGAMLYEVLSGKRPFADTTSIDEVLRLAAERPPPPLSTVEPEIPAELAAIVERAMAFEPGKRYRDARALADDLKRFQTGQLVGAHRYTSWQLVRRWVRRNAAVVTAASIGVVALAAVGGYSVMRIRDARDRAIDSEHRAVSAQSLAEERAAALAEEQGRQLVVSGDPARGLPYLAAAVEAGRMSPGLAFVIARALDSMSRVEAVLSASTAPLQGVTYSPDGARLVTSGNDGGVRIWDAHRHVLVRGLGKGAAARWTPEGSIAVISEDGSHVELRDPETGHGTPLPGTLTDPVESVAVTKGHVAIGGRTGSLTWWTGTGAPVTVALAHVKPVLEVVFSPDGSLIASGSEDGHAKVWRVADGAPVAAVTLDGPVRALDWSPDGTKLVTGTSGSSYLATIWDAKTGATLAKLAGHKDSVEAARFDRTGARVLTGSRDNTCALWDAATGALIATLPVAHHVVDAQWAPDGTSFAARDEHGDISLFAASGAPIATLAGHTGSLSEIAFAPAGTQLASVGLDGDLRLWRLSPEASLVTLAGPPQAMWHGAFSPDGKRAAVSAADGVVRVYDGTTGALLHELKGHTGRVNAVDFSKDGHLVTAGEDGMARIWDGDRAAHNIDAKAGRVRWASWSPDGTRIATTHGDGTARVWTAAGEPMFTLHASRGEPRAALWSPDGTRLLVTLDHGGADLFAADGKALGTAVAPVEFVTAAAWTRDGAQFALGASNARLVFVHDGKTAASVSTLEGHTLGPVFVLEASPDGRDLLSSSADGTARLWRGATTRLALGDGSSIMVAAAYRGDGALVATGVADGIASVWDATTGKQVGSTLITPDVGITQVRWSPDGERLLVMTNLGAKLWHVPAWHGTAPELATRLRCALHWRLDGATLVPAAPDPTACR